MAGRDVDVNVNMNAGGTLGPALAQWMTQVQQLQKAIDTLASTGAGVSQMAQLQMRLAALQAKGPPVMGAPLPGAAAAAAAAEERAAGAEGRRQFARLGTQAGSALSAAAPRMGATSPELALAQGILGSMPGLWGAVGTAAIGVAQVVAGIVEGMRQMPVPLHEFNQLLREAEGNLLRLRSEGGPGPAGFRETFATRPGFLGRLGAATTPGERRGIMDAEIASMEGELAAESTHRPGEAAADLAAMARRHRDALRMHGGGALIGITFERREWLRRYGYRPEDVPPEFWETDRSRMGEDWVRGLARFPVARTGILRTGIETLRTAVSEGRVPSLAFGVPDLSQLPNLFRSRQEDYLDVHERMQGEMVRDMREENRFQAQMALWERILTAITRGEGAVAGSEGGAAGIGGLIGGALAAGGGGVGGAAETVGDVLAGVAAALVP